MDIRKYTNKNFEHSTIAQAVLKKQLKQKKQDINFDENDMMTLLDQSLEQINST
jgi:hypothetical protein